MSNWTTKPKFTQDGWTVDYDDEEDNYADCGSQGVFEENGEAVCFVVSVPYDSKKMDKRASLIAAAPELVDALKIARDYMSDAISAHQNQRHNDPLGRIPQMLAELAQVDAALAKAGA